MDGYFLLLLLTFFEFYEIFCCSVIEFLLLIFFTYFLHIILNLAIFLITNIITLKSLNKDYSPIVINEDDDFRIIGHVVAVFDYTI